MPRSLTNILISSLLGLGSLLLISAAADEQASHKTSSAARNIYTEPGLWKIADTDTTIYLFGTVHILSKDIEWRGEKFDAAWDKATIVYFETDTSPEAQAGIQSLVFKLGMNEQGTTLSSFFSSDEIQLIKEEASKLGLPFKTLEPYRPWFASLTISVMQIIAAGGDPEAGVEMILGKEAETLGRERRFFETNEEQIRFFADLPDQVASEMLIESIKQTREQPNYFNDLISAWKTGNTDELGKLLNDAMDESDPVLADTLLYKRNEKWAATLKGILENEEGTFFVAVGAGHLAGDKKVQDYLLEIGVTTERL